MKLYFISEIVNPREEPEHGKKSYQEKNSLKRTVITYNTNNYYKKKLIRPKNDKAREHNEKFRSLYGTAFVFKIS